MTDITSGHKAAADCGQAGGCERGEWSGVLGQTVRQQGLTPGLHTTVKLRSTVGLLWWELSHSRHHPGAILIFIIK